MSDNDQNISRFAIQYLTKTVRELSEQTEYLAREIQRAQTDKREAFKQIDRLTTVAMTVPPRNASPFEWWEWQNMRDDVMKWNPNEQAAKS